jgi:hypothetical protein
MMGGTLETKKASDWLSQDLEKPEWMIQVPPDLWTEDQQEQVVDFEKKVRELMEARAAQKKIFDTELKKLRYCCNCLFIIFFIKLFALIYTITLVWKLLR